MKSKIICRLKLLRRFSKPHEIKSIHDQIAETIAERNRIIPSWEKLFLDEDKKGKKDIHSELKETISAFRKAMSRHENFFISNQNRKAA